MLLVLCRDPFEPSRPGRSFVPEVAPIERLGIPHILIDHEAFVVLVSISRDGQNLAGAPAPGRER
jgi:hypothetical protein